jgi:hypothetical protein
VFGVHHDDGGTVGLKLLHDLEAILEVGFVLSLIDFILQCLDGGLKFANLVSKLVFASLNGFVSFQVIFLLLGDLLSI